MVNHIGEPSHSGDSVKTSFGFEGQTTTVSINKMANVVLVFLESVQNHFKRSCPHYKR